MSAPKATITARAIAIVLFAGLLFPALVIGSFVNAQTYDPFTEAFFPKQPIDPSSELPGSLRQIGWIIIAIGAAFSATQLRSGFTGRVSGLAAAVMAWIGLMICAYGATFFVAADTAQAKIEQEIGSETRPA